MGSPRRAGYLLLVLGILLFSLTFVFAGGTDRACPEIDSAVYDTIGVQPGAFGVTDVDLSNLEVEWYDGCNWHGGSLLFPILGIVTFTAGLVLSSKPRGIQSNSAKE